MIKVRLFRVCAGKTTDLDGITQAQEELATIKKQGGAPERGNEVLEGKLKALQKDYDELATKSGQAPKSTVSEKKAL